MNAHNKDIAIIGGGMIGLAIAHQITERYPDLSITIIDKENAIGLHSSGRNSGVLHAGLYYKPNTLKAKVCIEGRKRLKAWCEKEGLSILNCGKIITPQSHELDQQLDLLIQRGKANGAKVELINEKEFTQKVPQGKSMTGRAIWSPETSVVDPKQVLARLTQILKERGVKFHLGTKIIKVDPSQKRLSLIHQSKSSGVIMTLEYGHLFNTAGLQADRVAHKFGVGENFRLLPFKGTYWQLDPRAPISIKTNLYPVPDLNIPFLGVHFSPSPDGNVYLGPTAIPAWGRENYKPFENIEPLMALQFLGDLAGQWWKNKNGFRQYAHEQALQGFKPLFLKAAQALIPTLQSQHLIACKKVGIRPQLYDLQKGNLVQDFLIEQNLASTHVLNAISPAFTASFSLADLILNQSSINSN